MTQSVDARTFAVSRVAPATRPLGETAYPLAVASFLRRPIESCSKYHGRLVANVASHPLVAAAHAAFCDHRPLCLSPDIIWLTLAQGFAIHINQDPERFRSRFVEHEGKLTIKVRRDDFVKGGPENPWSEVFAEFSSQIQGYIGSACDLVAADFSTTGAVERAAADIVLMDTTQAYFSYELHTACGIPSLTLEGTVDDWRAIAQRVERFREFDLDWWVRPLRPVLHEFVNAAAGRINRGFWESLYKYCGPRGSGSPHVTGWISTLFPYMTRGGGRYVQNEWIAGTTRRQGPNREDFPSQPAGAPFKWIYEVPPISMTYDMELIGGLIGVTQDPDTLTIRPEIGWAVSDARQLIPSWQQQCPRQGVNPFSIL